MIIGSIPVLSPEAHRRIDQLSFPALVPTSALLSRRVPRAGSIALLTAAVEGAAHLNTDDPPGILPWIGFQAHNRWAFAHGRLFAALSLSLPGLSRRGRWALRGLAAIPIVLAAVSDTRRSSMESRSGGSASHPTRGSPRGHSLGGLAAAGG
ncbi:MAG: hypothetical protein U0790_21050 [Isosphaeraceae bacterium]